MFKRQLNDVQFAARAVFVHEDSKSYCFILLKDLTCTQLFSTSLHPGPKGEAVSVSVCACLFSALSALRCMSSTDYMQKMSPENTVRLSFKYKRSKIVASCARPLSLSRGQSAPLPLT